MPAYKLVVAGNKFSANEISKIDKNLLQKIIIANNVSDAELNVLYNYAHALIYPSSYEGFGIPVVEAMKAGCPVIALNTSSIPEVSGNAAILFDDLNIPEFVNAIKNLENKDVRSEMQGKGFEKFKKI